MVRIQAQRSGDFAPDAMTCSEVMVVIFFASGFGIFSTL